MTEAEATCLCGKARCVVRLEGPIPMDSSLCHQSVCRYNLGGLFHSALAVQDRPATVECLKSFMVDGSLTRYFCGTCGSHLFEYSNGWRVQSGVLDRIHSEQVFEALETIVEDRYVHETVDGGLSLCLRDSRTSVAEHPPQEGLYSTGTNGPHLVSKPTKKSPKEELTKLNAACLCDGVRFFVTRPNNESRLCSSPWPDLIAPYHTHSSQNPQDEKWWIRDGNKWLAGTCACRSCRLGLGSPVQAWAFVSKANIFQPDGKSLTYGMGTMQAFESSSGAVREFCSNCGATVFWHNSQRPDVVDVSVGLLRAQEGVMARSWLKWWTARVSFAEMAFDRQLISTLEIGLKYLDDPL